MTQAAGNAKLSPLQLAELTKAATDQGFDRTPVEEGYWLLCRSTQFAESVWVTTLASAYLLACDSHRVIDELVAEGHRMAIVELPENAAGGIGAADYADLYLLLERVAEIAETSPPKLMEHFVAQTKAMPTSTEAERLVVQRVGQDIFRNALIAFWHGRCPVTGLAIIPLLRASHIKPWAACDTNEERLDVFNGLLLAPHFDALFDGGWITFNNEGRLVKSSSLDAVAAEQLGIGDDLKIAHLAAEHHRYLEYHRQHIFKN